MVLFLEQWKEPAHRPAGAVGVARAVLSLLIFGPDNLVISAMILILAVLLGGRKRKCA